MLAGDKTQSKETARVNTDQEREEIEVARAGTGQVANPYVAAVEEVFPALEEIISGYEKGAYALAADGTPDATTLQAIRRLVEDVSGRVALSGHAKEHFLSFLERAIIRWFRDCVRQSQGIATLRFRRMLTSISSKIAE